jgi:2-(1,2-epoxy-1,2-dihydrophenyl)acetyl-CoA isomerase
LGSQAAGQIDGLWPVGTFKNDKREDIVTDELLESFDDGVATLTMNRPSVRNALGSQMLSALDEALPRLAADRRVRCVVLTGAGGAFCAGGDVKSFAASASGSAASLYDDSETWDLEGRALNLRAGMELSRLLHEMPKPTLAAIPGAAAGAGFSLAMACDLRIALDTAKLTTAFAKVGVSGDYGVSFFLPYIVGQAKARELLFTAPILTGREAFEIGLVSRFADAEHYHEAVDLLARELAQLPTIAVGYMKKNLNAAYRGTLADSLDREAMHIMRCFMTQDQKRAAIAFAEKRKPQFTGH